MGDRPRVSISETLEDPDLLEVDLEPTPREEVARPSPDQTQYAALGAVGNESTGALDHVRVEASAQPLVAAHDDNERAAVWQPANGEQRVKRWIDAARKAAEDTTHLHGVGPRVHDPLLRAPQLRGGDHLHRLCDLLRVFHRAHAAPDVNQ